MMNPLISLLTSPEAAAKSALMLEKDPHGVVLTVTSVLVVFSALIILRYAFGFVGKLFTGQIKFPSLRRKSKGMSEEEAVAVAMALSLEKGSGEPDEAVAAAIALALHEELEGSVHDYESYVITIKR